ncbi:MAG TPA: SURF1 family protein [Actinomycetota bacterium]|nr:SURF1 family protein [Actinomycetota bacterium]
MAALIVAGGRPRRALLFVVAVVVAAVCVRLGFWQLDRLEQRRAFNERIGAALASEPVPLATALDAADPTFRRVTVEGSWDSAHEVILFGRSLQGRPGNHVLTPLTYADDRAVLVDRGWVPSDVGEAPVTGAAAAATGQVTVEGVVLPSDGDGAAAPSPATLPDQVRTVDVGALDAAIPASLVPDVYVLLERQAPRGEPPIPAPLPEVTEGPHLGYAIQWFTFAAVALVGYGVLARRLGRERPAPQADTGQGGI